jgi:hypothetical protein
VQVQVPELLQVLPSLLGPQLPQGPQLMRVLPSLLGPPSC